MTTISNETVAPADKPEPTVVSGTNLGADTEASSQNPLDKSYESMGSQDVEEPHYNFDSDGEPPTDEIGDKLTVIHKR